MYFYPVDTPVPEKSIIIYGCTGFVIHVPNGSTISDPRSVGFVAFPSGHIKARLIEHH